MNAEVKEKWIAALRSGKYQQGRNFLCTEKGEYCCLGVLADIQGWEIAVGNQSYPDKSDMQTVGIDNAFGSLPKPINNDSTIPFNGLAELNDDGWTFEQIADVIEKQF